MLLLMDKFASNSILFKEMWFMSLIKMEINMDSNLSLIRLSKVSFKELLTSLAEPLCQELSPKSIKMSVKK